MKLIRNARTMLSNPEIAQEYLNYQTSKLKESSPTRYFSNAIKISGFDGFSEFYDWKKMAEPEIFFVEKAFVTPRIIIDIGANLGLASVILIKHFSERKIYSIEPNFSTFQALIDNIKLNNCNNIYAEQCAVGNYDGEILFNAEPTVRVTNSITTTSSQHTVKVPSVKLDTYAQSQFIKDIAFLKIDVEGYETLVLQGAQRLLSNQHIKQIYYEVNPEVTMQAGFAPESPTQMLRQNGYESYKLNAQGALVLTRNSDISQIVGWDSWIAIPK